MKIGISPERVRELFSYDPREGLLRWRVSNTNRIKIGDVAGSIATSGRRYVNVDGKQYLVHRLIWLFVKGEEPKGYIRQKNGDFDDNRWDNLYESTVSETNLTRRAINNNTGFRGVSYNARKGKYRAQIKRNYKAFFLGYFDTAEQANEARIAAEARIPTNVSAEDFAFLGDEVKAERWCRILWDHMIAECNGKVGWRSFSEFMAEVGVPLGPNYSILPSDDSVEIGPGNWKLEAPLAADFDMSSIDGRNAYQRERNRRNPNLDRNNGLKSRYGVDLAWVQRQLVAQDGVCAICKKPETQITKSGKLKSLVVDHVHLESGEDGPVRGILCHACNSALGYFQDSVDILEAAIAYLRRYEQKDEAA